MLINVAAFQRFQRKGSTIVLTLTHIYREALAGTLALHVNIRLQNRKQWELPLRQCHFNGRVTAGKRWVNKATLCTGDSRVAESSGVTGRLQENVEETVFLTSNRKPYSPPYCLYRSLNFLICF